MEIYLCRGADPESKGKIENTVKFIKGNFLNNRLYVDDEILNRCCLDWLERTGNTKVHGTSKALCGLFVFYAYCVLFHKTTKRLIEDIYATVFPKKTEISLAQNPYMTAVSPVPRPASFIVYVSKCCKEAQS